MAQWYPQVDGIALESLKKERRDEPASLFSEIFSY